MHGVIASGDQRCCGVFPPRGPVLRAARADPKRVVHLPLFSSGGASLRTAGAAFANEIESATESRRKSR